MSNSKKQKLFSVTKDDFEWQFFRAGGKGGQNQNKRSTACRCIHRDSSAIGESREERSQLQNRQLAFSRCVNSKEFQSWLRVRAAAIFKGFQDVEKLVDDLMKPENLKIEYYTPKGDNILLK
jgi:protein subunit release factor A